MFDYTECYGCPYLDQETDGTYYCTEGECTRYGYPTIEKYNEDKDGRTS